MDYLGTKSSNQQERLAEALDEYLCAVESGESIDMSELLIRYPDLSETLQEYLPSLAWLRAGFADLNDLDAPAWTTDFTSSPRRLGDYELLRQIGRGGMGVVYEAQQQSLDRRVALKILPFASMLDRKQILRFQNEARAAAQLQHPNIVPIHGVGSDQGVHFYAMQLINGQSLRQVLENRSLADEQKATSKPESVHQSINTDAISDATSQSAYGKHVHGIRDTRAMTQLVVQAADALQTAHECGIIHRDIKPSNLLIDENRKLWITDFGLASSSMDDGVTATGDIIGTLPYMSPEQASGQSTLVDHRTDVYSLGVTLYELLTNCRPFEGTNHNDVLRQIESGECKGVRHWTPSIPKDLENVVAKAMATDREERYASAREMADDLERFHQGIPTVARPPSTAQRITKWARRHQTSVLAAIAVAMLSIASLTTGIIVLYQERAETAAALATSQANENLAEQRLVLAKRNLEEARSAVDTLGTRAAELLSHVPRTEFARRNLLESVLHYHERLLIQQNDSPQLRTDKAMTHAKMGAINEQLGDDQRASEQYEIACQLFTELLDMAEDNDQYGREAARLATCLNNHALVIARLGRTDDAKARIAKAIKTLQTLITETPEQSDLQRSLATSWNNLGIIQADHDTAAARECYRSAIKILEQPASAAQDNSERLLTLATVFRNLSLLVKADHLEEAIRWSQESMKLYEKLVESEPTDLEYKAHLANSYSGLTSLLSKRPMENMDKLLETYADAEQTQRELIQREPFRIDRRRELAITLNNRGLMETRLQRFEAAEKSLQSAITTQEQILEEVPGDLTGTSQLGGMHNNLGMVYQLQGQDKRAAESYLSGIHLLQIAYTNAPDVHRFRNHLSRTLYNYGRVLRQQGSMNQAAQTAIRRRKLWPNNAKQLIRVSEEIAEAIQFMSGQRRSRYQREINETLRLAINAGWKPDETIMATTVYEVMHTEPVFRRHVHQLERHPVPNENTIASEEEP